MNTNVPFAKPLLMSQCERPRGVYEITSYFLNMFEVTFPSANQSQYDIQQVKKVICEEKPAMASLFSSAKLVFQKMGKKFKDRWFDLEESEELDDMGEYRCLISRNKESGKLLFLNTCNPVTFINSPIIA